MKLPEDLMTWISFQAEFALSPIVTDSLHVILETQNRFVRVPGQRALYVSRAHAFAAFEEFVASSGIGPQLDARRKVLAHHERQRKAIADTHARQLAALKSGKQ